MRGFADGEKGGETHVNKAKAAHTVPRRISQYPACVEVSSLCQGAERTASEVAAQENEGIGISRIVGCHVQYDDIVWSEFCGDGLVRADPMRGIDVCAVGVGT